MTDRHNGIGRPGGDDPSGSVRASDADLLSAIRSGDVASYDVLRARHAAAARSLAGHLLPEPAAVDDVVAAAFTLVLDTVQRGGGPADAFRPYLLTALRRTTRGEDGTQIPADEQQTLDPGQPFADPELADLASSAIVWTFLLLPERWRAALWHIEIERASPAQVAELLGLSAPRVAELAARARGEFRQAYRQLHAADSSSGQADLGDLSVALRTTVAPMILGRASAAYLADLEQAAAAGRRGWVGSGWVGTRARLAGVLRGARRRPGIALAGVCVLLAAAVAAPLSLSSGPRQIASQGNVSRLGPATSVATTPASQRTRSGAPRNSPSPPAPAPHRSSAAPPSPAPPGTSPVPAPPRQSAPPVSAPPHSAPPRQSAGDVSAQVSVSGPGLLSSTATVSFGVTDTGHSATDSLTASVALPPGATLRSERRDPGSTGWNCVPTSGGAQCSHAAISAADQASGSIAVEISGSAACGKPVQVTVTGGAAPATADSSGTIRCL